MFRVPYLSQLMRFWYLSHRRPAKAEVILLICSVSPEPSLFAHMKYGSQKVQPKIRHLAPLDGWACVLEEWVYGSTIISWAGSFHFCLQLGLLYIQLHLSPVKRICVFEHSVMTNFNCACPAIKRGQGSGFLSEGSSWLTACMSEQRRFWRDCADAQARLNLRCSHRR